MATTSRQPDSLLLVTLPLLLAGTLPALDFAGIFTDHMVLQRGVAVLVWGRADPGEPATVHIDQQTKNTTADASGAWALRLDALQTAAPWMPKGPDLREPPNTIIIPTTDLDHTGGGHPPTKSAYGARDGSVAGNKMRLAFTHASQGLTCPAGQKRQGLAIAGADRAFAWAKATIDGDDVVMHCASVPSPVMAQYWAAPRANPFNRDGLPASGFRCSLP